MVGEYRRRKTPNSMQEGNQSTPVPAASPQPRNEDLSGVWSSKGVATKAYISPKVSRVNSMTETPLSLRYGLASIQGSISVNIFFCLRYHLRQNAY